MCSPWRTAGTGWGTPAWGTAAFGTGKQQQLRVKGGKKRHLGSRTILD